MKNFFLIILLALLASQLASAQDWKTVRLDDTVFFVAGVHAGGTGLHGGLSADSGLLRAIYVDIAQFSGDSIFYFPTGIRDTSAARWEAQSGCMDTVAPSWLGTFMIRRSNGVELYLNGDYDTLEFRTKASVGDSWTIVKDRAGIEFRALITGATADSVDDAADSIKTARIETFQAGVKVAHYYDGMLLRWSKDHGWISTLDLYQFPRKRNFWDYGGLAFDSTLHERIPSGIAKANLYETDLQWVCQPGNEWITNGQSAGSPSPVPAFGTDLTQILTHDSVISVNSMTVDLAIVQLKRTVCQIKVPYPSGSPGTRRALMSSSLVIDTLYRRSTAKQRLLWLVLDRSNNVSIDYRPFARRFCDDHYFIDFHKVRVQGMLSSANNCLKVVPRDAVLLRSDYYLSGLGGIGTLSYSGENFYDGYLNSFSYDYLRLGNCVFGRKYDVIKLGTGTRSLNEHLVSLAPNPADKQVRLRCSEPIRNARIRIADMLGKTIMELVADGTEPVIEVSGMTPGVYLVQISGVHINRTLRLVVRH